MMVLHPSQQLFSHVWMKLLFAAQGHHMEKVATEPKDLSFQSPAIYH